MNSKLFGVLTALALSASLSFSPARATTPQPVSLNLTAGTNSPANNSSSSIDVWWPINNFSMTATQPFKALIQGMDTQNYKMFWQVDNGQLNLMETNWSDYPHKEASLDLTGWNWKGTGPYIVNFVAQDLNGNTLASKSVTIYNSSQVSTPTPTLTPTPTPSPVPTVAPAPTPMPAPTAGPTQVALITYSVSASASGLSGAKLYVNPYSDAANWLKNNGNPASSPMNKIAQQPETEWFGNWNSNIQQDVNNTVSSITNSGAVPVLVTYNIPQRDCGGYSAGGSNSPDSYKQWIRSFAQGIGGRRSAVILEPDALASMNCLSASDQQTRINLLKDAVSVLKSSGKVSVYIDAGHPGWVEAGVMANLLQQAGLSQADGFSLNVSNFISTSDNISYGTNISQKTNGKHFVVDTGRNGSGPTPDYQWCNPSGRSLGNAPTTNTGNSLVDAFLWVKPPGSSDGWCGGGPAAGAFWPDYALGLAQRASQ